MVEVRKAQVRLIVIARVYHSLCLASAIAVGSILMSLSFRSEFIPLFVAIDSVVITIYTILGGFSLAFLIIGVYWPRLAGWHNRATLSYEDALWGHIVIRLSFLEAAVILDLVLGVLSRSWYVWPPLLTLAIVALILAFPTKRRLAKLVRKENEDSRA